MSPKLSIIPASKLYNKILRTMFFLAGNDATATGLTKIFREMSKKSLNLELTI